MPQNRRYTIIISSHVKGQTRTPVAKVIILLYSSAWNQNLSNSEVVQDGHLNNFAQKHVYIYSTP